MNLRRVGLSPLGFFAKGLVPALAIAIAVLWPAVAQANEPPEIQSFAIDYLGGGWWEVYGIITDEDPNYCEVYFTGPLDGYSADVSSNGEFALIVQLPSNAAGLVEAYALDPEYEWSVPASDYLDGGT